MDFGEARQLKEVVAEQTLELRLPDRGWGRRGMRYPAAEKLEIIRLVEIPSDGRRTQARCPAREILPMVRLPERRVRALK